MSVTLAIDFAWRNSGFVIVGEDGNISSHGLIKTSPRKKKNKSDRDISKTFAHEKENYDYLKIEIVKLIKRSRADILVAEVPFFAQKSMDAILIGMGWALLKELGFEFLTASQVKFSLTGNKQASKKEIASVVNAKTTGLLFAKDHVVDAYATYLAYRNPFVSTN